MGAGALMVHKGISFLMGTGRLSNAIATLTAVLVAVIIYIVCLVKLKGISEQEIYGLPKGATLVALSKKLRLL